MARVLTSRFVESVKGEVDRTEYPDAALPGFALRVSSGECKSFTLRYREGGVQKRKTWPFPAYSLKEARGEAENVVRAVGRGERPSAIGNIDTVGLLSKAYTDYLKKNVKRWKTAEGEINNHIIPYLGDMKIGELGKSDVRKIIDDIGEAYPVASNRVLARLRAMFNWAIDNDVCEKDPTRGLRKRREKSRTRVLNDDELRVIWRSCETLGSPAREYFKFLILCGQRRDDVRCMTFEEFDRAGNWVIGGGRYKSGKSHLIPLTQRMMGIIGEGKGFVFTYDGVKPYANLVKPKRALDMASRVTDWVIHDVRRTFRTGLSRLGVRPDIAERVIGHSVGGKLGETYDLYSYRDEKLGALKQWDEYLNAITAG